MTSAVQARNQALAMFGTKSKRLYREGANMKRIIRPLLIALSLVAPTVTLASVTYTFDFTDINSANSLQPNPKPDFDLTLTYPGFVTTTGMMNLVGNPLPTTLGYSVARAGTNIPGWWGFGAAPNGGLITDTDFGFVGQSFLFQPNSEQEAYFTTPGTFAGIVEGNDPTAFFGNAVLTITETSVPEPSTVWLLTVGLLAIVVSLRRNVKAGNRTLAVRSTVG